MKVKVLARTHSSVNYLVLDDAGNELENTNRTMTEEEAGKRTIRSLQALIAKSLGASEVEPTVELAAEMVEPQTVVPHLHAEFEELAEHLSRQHAHPGHSHAFIEHKHDDSVLTKMIGMSDRRALTAEDAISGELGKVLTRLAGHDHSIPEHGHAALMLRLEALEAALTSQKNQVAEHVHSEVAKLAALTVKLEDQLVAQRVMIDTMAQHGHPEMLRHLPDHSHEDIKQLLADHVDSVKLRVNARILSEQEVGGHKRIVLEVLE